MIRNSLRVALGIAFLMATRPGVVGQEVPQFYKPPETVAEFWRAMNHEIELGQFNVAAGYLKGFLAKNPSDEELLQIQDQQGSSAFHRLLTIPQLRADAQPLVERVDALVQKHLNDPKRLAALIKNLNATPEERSYAIAQLSRAGAAAMPALIDALLGAGDVGERSAILSALPKMDRRIIPPLLAALDVDDPNVRSELIAVLSERAETAATPYLWYLSASPKQQATVRDRATRVLAAFLGHNGERRPLPQVAAALPPAKSELTSEAERYYQHRIKFAETETVPVWHWDSGRKLLVSQALPVSKAEEYFGLRFAGQALDLDPSYAPAQIVYLSFLLDKEPDSGAVKEVLRSVNPELIIAVLRKALAEQRLPVILAATTALGDLAEVRALRPSGAEPPVLVRALDYPDRRVQLAAADAVLRIPTLPAPAVAARVVEILSRAVVGEPEANAHAKVLVGFHDADIAHLVANNLRKAGYQPVIARSGREVLRRLNQAADIDALLIDSALSDPGLADLLAQLRADRNAAHLPLLLTAPGVREPNVRPIAERYAEEKQRFDANRDMSERFRREGVPDLADRYRQETARREESLGRLTRRYGEESATLEENLRHMTERQPNVTVISSSQLWDEKKLGQTLQARLADPASKPLAGAEERDRAAKALEWLARLARGEVGGYELRPAADAILKALQAKDLANLAVEAAGHLPGPAAQRELANVVLDSGRPEGLRSAAAIELCRHIQQYGLFLTPEHRRSFETLSATLQEPKLKANVALVLGSMHPDARQTGDRLRSFTPSFTTPSAPAAAPADGKEKETSPPNASED